MSNIAAKLATNNRRLLRTRTKLVGTAATPRLVSIISNKHVSAQLIDDENARTLITVTSRSQKIGPNLTDKAKWVGENIAKKAKAAKINKVIFDRGSRRYHGRIKALAEAAKSAGLEF